MMDPCSEPLEGKGSLSMISPPVSANRKCELQRMASSPVCYCAPASEQSTCLERVGPLLAVDNASARSDKCLISASLFAKVKKTM